MINVKVGDLVRCVGNKEVLSVVKVYQHSEYGPAVEARPIYRVLEKGLFEIRLVKDLELVEVE